MRGGGVKGCVDFFQNYFPASLISVIMMRNIFTSMQYMSWEETNHSFTKSPSSSSGPKSHKFPTRSHLCHNLNPVNEGIHTKNSKTHFLIFVLYLHDHTCKHHNCPDFGAHACCLLCLLPHLQTQIRSWSGGCSKYSKSKNSNTIPFLPTKGPLMQLGRQIFDRSHSAGGRIVGDPTLWSSRWRAWRSTWKREVDHH